MDDDEATTATLDEDGSPAVSIHLKLKRTARSSYVCCVLPRLTRRMRHQLDGRRRTGRVGCWRGRLSRLTHVLLAHLANFQRQALLVGEDVAVLHLEFGGVLGGGEHSAALKQLHDQRATLFEHLAVALLDAAAGRSAAAALGVLRFGRSRRSAGMRRLRIVRRLGCGTMRG